jgi:hypothetical protein
MGKKLEHWEAEVERASDGMLDAPDDWAPMLSVYYRWLMAEHKRKREGNYARAADQIFLGTVQTMEEAAETLCKLAEREAAGLPWPFQETTGGPNQAGPTPG